MKHVAHTHNLKQVAIGILGTSLIITEVFLFTKAFAQEQQNATTTPQVIAPAPAPPEPLPPAQPSASISELGESAGLGRETVQEFTIPQADPSIGVTAKIEAVASQSNKEGLGILKGDVETHPEEFLFFEERGKKEEKIKISELIDEGQLKEKREEGIQEAQERGVEGKQEAAITVQGDAIKKLSEMKRLEEQGVETQIDVENIMIKKEEGGVVENVLGKIFGKKEDEDRIEIEITNSGEIKVVEAEDIEGDEELVVEYSFGEYQKSFEIGEALLGMQEGFAVEEMGTNLKLRRLPRETKTKYLENVFRSGPF